MGDAFGIYMGEVMKTRIKVAAIGAMLSSIVAMGNVHAANLSDILAVDDSSRPVKCALLISVREQWPVGSGIYWVNGSIIIPGVFPFPGGAYDPPGAAGPHPLEKALVVADSAWFHSLPCTELSGGYPSCDVVRYGPARLPGNEYTGQGVVNCHANDKAPLGSSVK